MSAPSPGTCVWIKRTPAMFRPTSMPNYQDMPSTRMTKRLTIRKRVAAACSQCKKSRMRCDDMRPCTRCQRFGKECVGSDDASRANESNGFPACGSVQAAPACSELGAFFSGFDVRSPRSLVLPMLNTFPPQMAEHALSTAIGTQPIGGSHDFTREYTRPQVNAPFANATVNEMNPLRLWETSPFPNHRPNIMDSVSACDARFLRHQQPPREETTPSLEQLIARQQEEILTVLGRLHPTSALDSLLLSAMLASPSSAPESRISAALRAVAALSAGRATTLPPLSIPWTFPTTTDLARTSIGI